MVYMRWVNGHFAIIIWLQAFRSPQNNSQSFMRLAPAGSASFGSWLYPAALLTQSPIVNASTSGAEQPTIVVNSGILDHLDDPSAVCVLGHELGHIHSDHLVYKLLAAILVQGGAIFGMISVFDHPNSVWASKVVQMCRVDG